MKPVFRFTVGLCLQQGLDILAESFRVTMRTLGVDNWRWVVCHNGLGESHLSFLRQQAGDLPLEFFAQEWKDCPIEDERQSPQRSDGSFEWNGNRCGGTMWKVCPSRIDINVHEIIMDNDIILMKKFHQIDEWLKQRDKALILEEPIRFYGRYDHLFTKPPYLNSGFMGLPPGYDFGAAIKTVWERHGSLKRLSQSDEQGLLTHTLNSLPNIRISEHQMCEFLGKDYNKKLTGQEEAVHFTQSNRMPNHQGWEQYQQIVSSNLMI